MDEARVAVIGAGIAGLACAHELARADAKVTVFERSRGLGGRIATRRHGMFAVDHGAQFITARSRPFAKYIGMAAHAGCAASWNPRLSEDERTWEKPIEDWAVGIPGMSAFVRPLARGLDLQLGVRVNELLQGQRGWEILTDSGRQSHVYDAVAVAVPAPQALSLLGSHGRAFRHLTEATMAPCWTAMMAFETPIGAASEAYRWTTGPLSWAGNDSSRPARTSPGQSWVVHASIDWSRDHLEADQQEAAQLLLNEFAAQLGCALPLPVHLEAHRWRSALVQQPLGLSCLIDEEIAAGACGDWCIAPRVEAAYESGRTLAHTMLSMIGLSAPVTRR
jgi:predicted NAD/FAD-dependent oxidoreductase